MSSSKDDIRVVVSIDFGTTFSGYAYAHKASPETIVVENKWTGSVGYKTPTIIKYQDESSSIVNSWGFDALPQRPRRRRNDHSKSIRLFKLFLLKESSMKKPFLPNKLDYKKVITDYLTKLGETIKEKLNAHWQNLDFYSQVLIVLTIPAEFNDDAMAIMRDCAFDAGLMIERDSKYLIFTTEPEAAAIYCLNPLEKLHNLKPGDSFMVVDCGGGTVDLTRHELLANSRLSEITERTGDDCGSSFVDEEFVKFLRRKLGNSTIELLEEEYCNVLRYMVHEFCKRAKIPFTGNISDFKRFEIDLEDYPLNDHLTLKDIIKEGKEKQLLKKADWLLRVEFDDVKEMFDPIIKKIICLIRKQLAQQDKKCSAIMLVGGFSESKYLQAKIKEEFSIIQDISVPMQPIIAVVKGGVQFGLQTDVVVNRVLKRTYGTDIVRRSLPNDPRSQILPNGFTIVFETLARRSKQISSNCKIVRKFRPYSLTQRNISFDLYVTKEHDVKFCDDPGVSLLRPWEIELPENDNYDDITILFTLTFGTIEILATAENEKTREKYQVKVKYE